MTTEFTATEIAHFNTALASTRAAMDVVASGNARRVIVHALACEQILPLARDLARAAGVAIEPMWWTHDVGCDLVITRANA